ncbi:MAG: PepSY domain-containing protein [Colwellia sp.]|jgi:Predicted membrane protein
MKNNLTVKNPLHLILLSVFILSLFSLASLAEDHDKVQSLVKSGEIQSLEVILQHLYKIEKGHILEVELERKRKRLVYEIELVNKDGIVKKYYFDAKSGALIKEKVKD